MYYCNLLKELFDVQVPGTCIVLFIPRAFLVRGSTVQVVLVHICIVSWVSIPSSQKNRKARNKFENIVILFWRGSM